jgi:uncharacterized membrane protein HdeD (DUF308 family)
MSMLTMEEREVTQEAAGLWWVFLVTGILWFLVSMIIFRFDYTTVSSISILFGIVAIFVGINEFLRVGASSTGWKIFHILFGLLFIGVGIVAFIHPGNTFAALAGVMSFLFVFMGALNIIVSIATRNESPVWWLVLVIGIAELMLGFWAAGYYGREVILLVVWVGAICLTRGLTEIVFAFKLHGLKKDLAAA